MTIASASVRGSAALGYASSSAANASRRPAAGHRPRRGGYSAAGSHVRPDFAQNQGTAAAAPLPWAEDGPEVPEDDDDRNEAQPENDPDERRREVVAGIGLPDQGRQPNQNEKADRKGAKDDPPAGPEDQPLPALGERPAAVPAFQDQTC